MPDFLFVGFRKALLSTLTMRRSRGNTSEWLEDENKIAEENCGVNDNTKELLKALIWIVFIFLKNIFIETICDHAKSLQHYNASVLVNAPLWDILLTKLNEMAVIIWRQRAKSLFAVRGFLLFVCAYGAKHRLTCHLIAYYSFPRVVTLFTEASVTWFLSVIVVAFCFKFSLHIFLFSVISSNRKFHIIF